MRLEGGTGRRDTRGTTDATATDPPDARGMRTRATIVGLILALLLGAATGCESTERARNELLTLVNQSRSEAGLRPVTRDIQLEVKADLWAQHMRDTCTRSHSVLKDGAPQDWYRLGENVGNGGSIQQVHTAFLDSPLHRANVLDPSFSSMGGAAVWGECQGQRFVFVVTVFMQPR